MLYDREAQNFRAQSKELAEAEALEEKAREHRERAVAQGELASLLPYNTASRSVRYKAGSNEITRIFRSASAQQVSGR